jgi:hypothetical protein
MGITPNAPASRTAATSLKAKKRRNEMQMFTKEKKPND